MKLNKTLFAVLVLSLCFATVLVADDTKAATDESRVGEFAGEVVDLRCYSSRGAHGEEHRACAIRCIESGAAAGLLSDEGQLYLLLGKELVTELEGKIGRAVVVKGRTVERDGMNFIFVDSVTVPVKTSRGGGMATWVNVVWWFLAF